LPAAFPLGLAARFPLGLAAVCAPRLPAAPALAAAARFAAAFAMAMTPWPVPVPGARAPAAAFAAVTSRARFMAAFAPRATGASDFGRSFGGVFGSYSHRSRMMHFGHAGNRAMQT